MKHFTPFLALFFSMLISCSWAKAQTSGTAANRVAVNGIAYNLDKVNKTAAVIQEFYTDEAGKTQQLCDFYSGEIVIPSSITVDDTQYTVTEISSAAFHSREITSITMPSTLKKICDKAFSALRGLSTLTIPASVEEIGQASFTLLPDLKTIVVEEGNTHFCCEQNMLMSASKTRLLCLIDAYDNQNPLDIILPSTIKSIDDFALSYDESVKSIALPEGLETIGQFAFAATGISSIAFPSTVRSIGESCLAETRNLNEITVNEANPYYTAVDGVLYDKDISNLIKVTVGHTSLSIPKTVKTIDSDAISQTNIRTLIIPNTVEYLKSYAIYDNEKLKTLVIGSSVKEIGFWSIPRNPVLKSVFSRNPEPVELSEGDMFVIGQDSIPTLFVPEGSSQKYAATKGWDVFTNIREYSLAGIDTYSGEASAASVVVDGLAYDLNKQEMTATVVTDSYMGENGSTNLCDPYSGSIVVPEEITVDGVTYPVTELGECCFTMRKIDSITLPSTLKKINYRGLSSVWGLKSITIPASVEEIESAAFTLNYDLEEMKIEEGNKHFVMEGNMLLSADKTRFLYLLGATDWNKSIDLKLPATVKTIDDSALYGSAAVTSLTLPEGLESIGVMGLGGISVSSIHIPSSVKSIGESFMVFAENLKEITLGEGNANFAMSNGMLLTKDMTELVLMPCIHDNYQIPESVTTLRGASASCLQTTSFVIPDGVKTLKQLVCAFSEMLETVVIGSGVENWGEGAFRFCESIKSIYLRSENVVTPTSGDHFEEALYDTATLYVPTGTKGLYQGDPYWGQFKNIVEFSVTDIESVIDRIDNSAIDRIYTLDGAAQRSVRDGLQILRMNDGKTKKVIR